MVHSLSGAEVGKLRADMKALWAHMDTSKGEKSQQEFDRLCEAVRAADIGHKFKKSLIKSMQMMCGDPKP